MRMQLEQINGVYQGACYPFREGFSSGLLREVWAPDQQSLFVGMTNRGWASTGKEPYGIQRLSWTGETPFEVQSIHVQTDGFLLVFTEALDPNTALDPAHYQIKNFTYKYHHVYGSPAIEVQPCQIEKAELAGDRRSVRLVVKGLKKGFVHQINAPGIRNAQGQKLLHDLAFYTLNELPAGATESQNASSATTNEVNSTKRVTTMPAEWGGKIEATLSLGTLAPA